MFKEQKVIVANEVSVVSKEKRAFKMTIQMLCIG